MLSVYKNDDMTFDDGGGTRSLRIAFVQNNGSSSVVVVVMMAGATEETFGVLQNASWCVTTQLTLERVALLHLLHTCAFRVLPGLLVTLLCVSLMKS